MIRIQYDVIALLASTACSCETDGFVPLISLSTEEKHAVCDATTALFTRNARRGSCSCVGSFRHGSPVSQSGWSWVVREQTFCNSCFQRNPVHCHSLTNATAVEPKAELFKCHHEAALPQYNVACATGGPFRNDEPSSTNLWAQQSSCRL